MGAPKNTSLSNHSLSNPTNAQRETRLGLDEGLGDATSGGQLLTVPPPTLSVAGREEGLAVSVEV